jgi:uncharacterized protein with NRDE domain
MCLVILAYRVVEGFPIVVAANRDERYARGGDPPQVLGRDPLVWGGRDPVAGGTWLGVNARGLLVALTGRPAGQTDPHRRSRGLLCLDALRQESAAALEAWLREELRRQPYNPFNLLYADGASAGVAYCEGSLRAASVSPGVHVLTGGMLCDRGQPKIARGFDLLADMPREWPGAFERLRRVCADRREGAPESDPICMRGERAGTVSSSILALGDAFPAGSFYFHAPGPPCETEYRDYSGLFSP